MKTGRILTLKVEIVDPAAADWIWKSHKEAQHGIKVWALAEGDLLTERDMFKEAAEFFLREEGETTEEAIQAHVDSFATPDEAASKVAKNISIGARWEVIDRKGNVHREGVNT